MNQQIIVRLLILGTCQNHTINVPVPARSRIAPYDLAVAQLRANGELPSGATVQLLDSRTNEPVKLFEP